MSDDATSSAMWSALLKWCVDARERTGESAREEGERCDDVMIDGRGRARETGLWRRRATVAMERRARAMRRVV